MEGNCCKLIIGSNKGLEWEKRRMTHENILHSKLRFTFIRGCLIFTVHTNSSVRKKHCNVQGNRAA